MYSKIFVHSLPFFFSYENNSCFYISTFKKNVGGSPASKHGTDIPYFYRALNLGYEHRLQRIREIQRKWNE